MVLGSSQAVFVRVRIIEEKETVIWAAKMAQWLKVLAAQPDSLSVITRTHRVEGENGFLHVVLEPPLVCCGMCPSSQ